LAIAVFYKIAGWQVLYLQQSRISHSPFTKVLKALINARTILSCDLKSPYDPWEYYKMQFSITNNILEHKTITSIFNFGSDLLEMPLKKSSVKLRNCFFRQIRGDIGIVAHLQSVSHSVSLNYETSCHYVLQLTVGSLLYTLCKQAQPNGLLNFFLIFAAIFKFAIHAILFFLRKSLQIISIRNQTIETSQEFESEHSKKELSPVMFLPHQGLKYGNLFEKDYYFREQEEHPLNKNNINFVEYETNVNLIAAKHGTYDIAYGPYPYLKVIKKALSKIIYQPTILFRVRSIIALFVMVKSLLIIGMYSQFLNKYRNTKIAILGYDVLCPAEFIVAAQMKNIRCIGIQERLNTTYSEIYPLVLDDYFVMGENSQKKILENKNTSISNMPIIGPIRASWLSERSFFSPVKNQGLNVLVFDCSSFPTDPHAELISVNSWENNKLFLTDILKLSKMYPNCKFTLRGKDSDWLKIPYFKNIAVEVKSQPNVLVDEEYELKRRSYQLIEQCDLVICRHTSIADETLSAGIPTLFYEKTVFGNIWMKSLLNYGAYPGFVNSFEELEKIFRKIMLNDAGDLISAAASIAEKEFNNQSRESAIDRLHHQVDIILNETLKKTL